MESTLSTSNLILVIEAKPASTDQVALTTKDGYTYGISGSQLVPATATQRWGTIDFDYEYYSKYDSTALNDSSKTAVATAIEKANIKGGETVLVKLTGGDRTRLILTAPTESTASAGDEQTQAQFAASDFATSGVHNQVTIGTFTVQAGGALELSSADLTASHAYYSIAGQLNNGADMSHTEVEASPNVTDDVQASFSQSLSLALTLTAAG